MVRRRISREFHGRLALPVTPGEVRLMHEGDANGFVGTGLGAGGRFTHHQSLEAHVALPHDAARGRIFRDVVRTLEYAVLATDALVVEMPNNPSDGILFISQNWTAIKTTGIHA